MRKNNRTTTTAATSRPNSGILYLLNEVNALLQVHTEVNELPLDAFLAVFLLLEDEHVMVEELLQTLVGVVDAQLLERVVLNTQPQHQSSREAIALQQSNCPAVCIRSIV